MEYRIAILPPELNTNLCEKEEFCYKIDKAKKIFKEFVKDAFNGEFVIAYKIDDEFTDIMPQTQIRKKTDYRYGEDIISDSKNRNKYLKFIYKNSLLKN